MAKMIGVDDGAEVSREQADALLYFSELDKQMKATGNFMAMPREIRDLARNRKPGDKQLFKPTDFFVAPKDESVPMSSSQKDEQADRAREHAKKRKTGSPRPGTVPPLSDSGKVELTEEIVN